MRSRPTRATAQSTPSTGRSWVDLSEQVGAQRPISPPEDDQELRGKTRQRTLGGSSFHAVAYRIGRPSRAWKKQSVPSPADLVEAVLSRNALDLPPRHHVELPAFTPSPGVVAIEPPAERDAIVGDLDETPAAWAHQPPQVLHRCRRAWNVRQHTDTHHDVEAFRRLVVGEIGFDELDRGARRRRVPRALKHGCGEVDKRQAIATGQQRPRYRSVPAAEVKYPRVMQIPKQILDEPSAYRDDDVLREIRVGVIVRPHPVRMPQEPAGVRQRPGLHVLVVGHRHCRARRTGARRA